MSDDSASRQLICVECGAANHGEYCSRCGHPAVVDRLTLRSILATTVEHFLSLDYPLMRTAVNLMRHPGRVGAQYAAGMRRRYTNPLKYSLITGALIVTILHFMTNGDSMMGGDLKRLGDSRLALMIQEAVPLGMKWHNEYLAIVYFLTLPILAWILRLLFSRSGRNSIELYAMCLYAFAQLYLIQAVFIALAMLHVEGVWGKTLTMMSGIAPYVYFPWAVVGFTRARIIWGVLRSLIAFLLFSIVISILLFGAAAGYIAVRDACWPPEQSAATQPEAEPIDTGNASQPAENAAAG